MQTIACVHGALLDAPTMGDSMGRWKPGAAGALYILPHMAKRIFPKRFCSFVGYRYR